MRLNLDGISDSPTLSIVEEIQRRRSRGERTLSLAVGEPIGGTPPRIVEAGVRALREGRTRYTPPAGIPELREKVCALYEGIGSDSVAITNGAKQALYNCLRAALRPQDACLIESPHWPSYPEIVKLCDADVVLVHGTCQDRFRAPVEVLVRRMAEPRIKAMLLCSPSNPTGVGRVDDELIQLVEAARRYDVIVILDDIYRSMSWNRLKDETIASLLQDYPDNFAVVGGLSKCCSMTGWRVGFLIACEALIRGCRLVQEHTTSCVNAAAQYAALEAIDLILSPGYLENLRAQYKSNHDLMLRKLQQSGVEVVPADGAFYLFPNLQPRLTERGESDVEFCRGLLAEEGVAVLPGTYFGAPGHVRLSFSADADSIREGMELFTRRLQTPPGAVARR